MFKIKGILLTKIDLKLLETPISKVFTQFCSYPLLVKLLLFIEPKHVNLKKLFQLVL